MEQTSVWCRVHKGNSDVLGCNGSVEMGTKARVGWNVATYKYLLTCCIPHFSCHVSLLTDHRRRT